LCSVAIDHFITYQEGVPEGLRDISGTLKAVAKGRPDAVTMHIGWARSAWQDYAGSIPLILQSSLLRVDESDMAQSVTPEDAVVVGADAFAVVCFVRGTTEFRHLQKLADCVRMAARFEMPVVCHVYPRVFSDGKPRISFAPEDVAWAVRCAAELGVDVIKVPYCGEVAAYRQIVSESPVRVVAAGGPKAEDLRAALTMVSDVMKSGAYGAVIGRNVWGFKNVTASIKAFKAVIHDGASPDDALKKAGI
jgi:class I fructose-bisphosphate aldolase